MKKIFIIFCFLFLPSVCFGATSTVSVYSVSSDGRTESSRSTFAEARDNGITVALWKNASELELYNGWKQPWVTVTRGYFYFDTSFLPDNAIISSSTLRLWITSVNPNNQSNTVYLTKFVGSSLDHPKPIDGLLAYATTTLISPEQTIPYPTFAKYVYFPISTSTLNIISTSSVTAMSMRDYYDYNNIDPNPSRVTTYLRFGSSEAEPLERPTLLIEYSTPDPQLFTTVNIATTSYTTLNTGNYYSSGTPMNVTIGGSSSSAMTTSTSTLMTVGQYLGGSDIGKVSAISGTDGNGITYTVYSFPNLLFQFILAVVVLSILVACFLLYYNKKK